VERLHGGGRRGDDSVSVGRFFEHDWSARAKRRRVVQKLKEHMTNKPRSAELHPGPGFRVKMNIARPRREMMERFRRFPSPDVSDLLNRLYAVDPQIRCLSGEGHQLCGPALTVKVYPGDNLMVHKALDVAERGDVVVVDASGSHMNAVLGDLISTKAKHRGIAGFVIDGLVRDLPNIKALDFPVFARGTSPIGPLHRGPGEINYSICCGGVVVNPGDLVVGDAMGVVMIPAGIAEELLGRLEEHDAKNAEYLAAVKQGNFSNAWVDRILSEMECPVVLGMPPVASGGERESAIGAAAAKEAARISSVKG
jgi:RraA family protein